MTSFPLLSSSVPFVNASSPPKAFIGGCYIGFGGLLSMVIAGQIPSSDPGTQTFVFAALFPVNLLLILLTGGSLFTGNTAAMPAVKRSYHILVRRHGLCTRLSTRMSTVHVCMYILGEWETRSTLVLLTLSRIRESLQAWLEGRCKWHHILKALVVSWVGNFLAAAMFAGLADYADLCQVKWDDSLTWPEIESSQISSCGVLAANVVWKKTKEHWGQAFVKGIMCNWMVCMAVFLSSQAQDMTGKMVGIWFPISAFVCMGMEHSVANMFMGPLGLIAGTYVPGFDVDFGEFMWKNMVPVTLGNFVAGSCCVAASYSFAWGALGEYPYCGLKKCMRRGEPGTQDGDSARVDPGVIGHMVQKVPSALA